MKKQTKAKEDAPKPRKSQARSVELREHEMISLAVDLAEQQLRDGTASSQIIAHYLKLGSTRERLERERLEQENKLLKAKTEALESEKRVEELYADALKAMSKYSGLSRAVEYEDDTSIQ